jgi:alanine racemase
MAHLSPFIELEGIFTHFADADGEHSAYTEKQFAAFQEAIRLLERNGIRAPLLHCCNSAAAMRYPHMHLDMVRVGIALYGLHPSSHTRIAAYPLRPAMSLVAHIAAVKRIEPGQTVGYGCSFAAVRPTVVATIPIGYADGLSRRLSNKASALLHGMRVPYIGKICMDQAMLDVTEAASSAVGDPVVIFGSGDDALHNSVNSIPVDEIAALLDTIHYEVVCAVGSRVAREYR